MAKKTAAKAPARSQKFVGCSIRQLPTDSLISAAKVAGEFNPTNKPPATAMSMLTTVADGDKPDIMVPQHLAFMTSKWWGSDGVRLTVGWLDNPPSALRTRILSHMNSWGEFCNVKFTESNTSPQVRISRGRGGYWSYLGTDILSIPPGQPTMNLEGFTMNTPESEFVRVVRHETGHTLGAPHEHMRREIVSQLDPTKTIAYFGRTQGWSPQEVRQQVLTPIEESELIGTPHADEASIMAYFLPSAITIDGQPIVGGTDFTATDKAFAAKVYPLVSQPPVVPPVVVPVGPDEMWVLTAGVVTAKYKLTRI